MKRPRKRKLIEMKMSPQRITELKAIRRSLADRMMDLSLDIRCKRYGMDLRGAFNEQSLVRVFESLIAELKLPLADALSALREEEITKNPSSFPIPVTALSSESVAKPLPVSIPSTESPLVAAL